METKNSEMKFDSIIPETCHALKTERVKLLNELQQTTTAIADFNFKISFNG